MSQNNIISCLEFTPSEQTLFEEKIQNFRSAIPTGADVTFFIRKVNAEIEFQGFLLMESALGEFKVCVDESSPERVIQTIERELNHLLSSKYNILKAS